MAGNAEKAKQTLRVRIYKAAQLLGENFSLDSTLREIVKVIGDVEPPRKGLPKGEAEASERSETSTRGSEEERAHEGAAQFVLTSIVAPPKKDTRHKDLVALFVKLWSENRGGRYAVTGADALNVKRLLLLVPDVTSAEIERRMRIAFADEWFIRCGSLSVFTSRWNTYETSIGLRAAFATVTPMRSAKVVVGLNADGSPKYAERRA